MVVRRMHLIVVRRDGAEFRHLHPEMDAAGTWTVPIEFDAVFPTPGRYRLYLQFKHEGVVQTAQFTVVVPR